MPRLSREAPLYSIWEGSGNVICLDILRALAREPESVEALLQEFQTVSGNDKRLDSYLSSVQAEVTEKLKQSLNTGAVADQGQARRLAEALALGLQAALVVRYSPVSIAEAFLASRIDGDHGYNFGTLPAEMKLDGILDRVIA